MQSLNLAYILDYLCSLRRFRSFLVGTHDSFCRFLKYVKFLVETRQSGFQKIGDGGVFGRVKIWVFRCEE